MSILRLSMTLAVALLAGTEFVAAQEVDIRDLSVQQQLVTEVTPPAVSDLDVSAWVDHEDNRYKVGESINLSVKVSADAYLTIVSVGPSGTAVLLYPNEFQPGVLLKGGATVEIPGENAPARIVATSPAGNELIRVIASRQPIDVIDPALLTGSGAFKNIEGGAEQLARDLAVAAQGNPGIVYYDKVIKTSEADLAEAPVANEPTEAEETMVEVGEDLTPPAAQPKLPPLIATDRSDYVDGDTVQLAVTTLEDCHLWVVDVSSDGSIHVLYPNKIVPENNLKANTTAVISGGNSKVKVVVAGGPSTEAVYALCSADATPPWTAGVDFSETFPALDADESLGKALVAIEEEGAGEDTVIPDVYAWSVKTLTVTAKQ